MKPAWVKAYGPVIARWMSLDGDHCTLKLDEGAFEELRASLAKLAALETEVAAWRALVRRFPQPVFVGSDEDGWLLEVGNSYGNGSGNTPQAAVLCIARQLNLIPEAK